jgi:hypothetical protein
MTKSKLRYAGLMGLAVGAAILGTTVSTKPASSQGGYYGQRATQDRDYSRMQSATQRAYGKTVKVTLKAKKKKRHKAKHKRRHKH